MLLKRHWRTVFFAALISLVRDDGSTQVIMVPSKSAEGIVLSSVVAIGVLVTFALLRSNSVQILASEEMTNPMIAQAIISRHCTECHSAYPSEIIPVVPANLTFDTVEQMQIYAAYIKSAVVSRTMPPGNSTCMTQAERAIVGRWADSIAKTSPEVDGMRCTKLQLEH